MQNKKKNYLSDIDKFLHQINIEHIVLETDSPYLAPTPLRGKRNESANIIYIAKKLSEIYIICYLLYRV